MTQRWVSANYFMISTFTSLFCKKVGCPTSQALLAFGRSLIEPEDLALIESHLASCDFCSAELQLLSRHPSEAEEYSFVEMPPQLRRLAEALLGGSTAPFKGLPELVHHQLSH